MLYIMVMFSVRLLSGLKNGNMFVASCVKWLVAWGVVYGFVDFTQSNAAMWGLQGDFSVLTLQPSTVIVPIFIFIFAALFRLAAKVSEDSNLAI